MNNIQINGQRIWGPPENWSGPPPKHGTEVFIKNIPEEVFEQELGAIFSAVGTVYEVRLPVHLDGFNRGYAFLRFTKVREADEAIARFDGYQIRKNRTIRVMRSIDNTRLFLSGVPLEKNSDDLKQDLLRYVKNVKKVYVYPTLENRSVYRGYAFVEFGTHRDAAVAKRILTPDICYLIFEKKCVAAWASPLPFLDQSILKSLNVLFMRNIPREIKGFHLKMIVENYIGQDEVKHIKRLNDFAFLTFKDHESAERALCHLQGIPFLIPDHETQVEWATPRELSASSRNGYPEKGEGGRSASQNRSRPENGRRGMSLERDGTKRNDAIKNSGKDQLKVVSPWSPEKGGMKMIDCKQWNSGVLSCPSSSCFDCDSIPFNNRSLTAQGRACPADKGFLPTQSANRFEFVRNHSLDSDHGSDDGFTATLPRKVTSSSYSSASTTWSGESPTNVFPPSDDAPDVFPPELIQALFNAVITGQTHQMST